jgi:hypothetical protein
MYITTYHLQHIVCNYKQCIYEQTDLYIHRQEKNEINTDYWSQNIHILELAEQTRAIICSRTYSKTSP